jgi:aerobic carbon-monoxide dehydrogenase medium subunit
MLLREVEYARPASVQDALRLLGENEGARALAGGQTLINVMKARAASPDMLVDLADLGELRGIELGSDGTLELGAMTTYTDIIESAEARARPILGEVCNQIADVQVRNRGTIGGNVCSNDPTNHLPPLFVALDAIFTIQGKGGVRWVSAEDFFLGVYLTAVGEGELLTAVSVTAAGHAKDGFAAVTIGADGTCIANAAASLDGDAPRVALGCVDAVPVLLQPESADEEAVRSAVRDAALEPPSDVHASAAYRRHLAEICAVRAVAQAQGRGA